MRFSFFIIGVGATFSAFSLFGFSQVENTSLFPYRAIGRLSSGCTGALIGPRHVLTSGHCIFNKDSRGWSEDLEFSPAQNGKKYPFGTVPVKKRLLPKDWKRNNAKQFDYALLILQSSIGNETGWLGFGVDEDLSAEEVSILGYPGEKTFGTLWRSRCPLLNISPQWLDYECETEAGMSGSPIIHYVKETQNNLIVGIHALGGNFNSGVRINSKIYKQLNQWKNDNP